VTPRAVYASPFIPAPWLAARGFQPSRLYPSRHTDAKEGVCPYADAFAAEAVAAGGAAVIFATTCDQMRRASELCPSAFLFNVPATWRSETARNTYRAELERLGRFLVHRGGVAPTPERIVSELLAYDGSLAEWRTRRTTLSARAAAESLMALHADGDAGSTAGQASSCTAPATGPRLALVGGPLFRDQFGLYDALETTGARVVLDATETGERTLPAPFDREHARADPLGEVVRAYFDHIPDVFRRPNDRLYSWLKTEVAARRVQGVLLLRHVWCDLWHAETQRLKDELGVPVVEVDLAAARGARETRIQALLEVFT
jgi:hypothetical protein